MTLRAGIVGCGAISAQYLQGLSAFDTVEVVAVADLDHDRAQQRADDFGIARACSTSELISDPGIDIVINLTIPAAHSEIAQAALLAGKHVYNEKPLSLTVEQARPLVSLASERGLIFGCAPDTFLGAGLQTCRALIDAGAIGLPIAASASFQCPGHESWHPSPAFYYQHGGGPMLDMGPYYVTALVNLLGPVRRVAGSAKITRPQRVITSEPLNGTVIDVEVPTHQAAVLDFEGGVTSTLVASFDVQATRVPSIEIHGTEGSLAVPDPNTFDGGVRLFTTTSREWRDVEHSAGHPGSRRGLGVADIADALASGRPPRASAELALHVLEVLESVPASSQAGRFLEMVTRVDRPEALTAPVPGFRE